MAALKGINTNVGPLLASGLTPASNAGSAAADLAQVVADTAVLVADGASPTQAHVTTLNGHVAALNAAFTGGVTVIFDPAKITTRKQLQAALSATDAAAAAGYGGLT